MTTVAEALREGAERLAPISDTARLDAEVLMADALGVTRSELLLRHMQEEVPARFAERLARRLTSEPIAYITGQQEFYGREFLVTPDVLIPRSDSETIVTAALDACPAPARVLDCGVGSGALLLTVLAERPGAQGMGIDCSQPALEIASRNAAQLGLVDRCTMELRDWHEAGWSADLCRFDLILANPPYIEDSADLPRSVRDFEPGGALFAGPEGLYDYRVLIPQLPALLEENGVAVLEIGSTQSEMVTEIAETAGFSVQLHKDLASRPRALVLRLGVGKDGFAG